MRNLFLALGIVCCSILVSCSNESGGISATEKKNLEVNDAIMKAYEEGNFDKMGDYIAADAVDHGGEQGDVKGLDNIVADMKRYHAMMPDMKVSNAVSTAKDDLVFTRATMSGTMNGKPTTMTSVDVSKFKDGKAIEHWIYMDPKELMAMMQEMPASNVELPKDSIPK